MASLYRGLRLMVRLATAQEVRPLRAKVLRPGQVEATAHFPKDFDLSTFHVVALVLEEIVSVASFEEDLLISQPELEKAYRLRGMATDPRFLKQGWGRRVLLFGENELRKKSVSLLWFNARERAIPFYEKCGYSTQGPFLKSPPLVPTKSCLNTFCDQLALDFFNRLSWS